MPTPDYSKKWLVMLAVGMGIFLATIDGSIVNIALPTLTEDLQTSFATVQWVVLSYLLTVTTLMLGVGRLADMRGKKRLYALGFVVFTVGSVLCGLAPGVYWLIGFRVLQGVGAAMTMALGTAIVTEAFPPGERGKALGISGAIVSIGIVIGPTLGGLLLQAFSWHAIFFVNLPVGILGTLLALRHVPAIQPPGGQRFDFSGALTLFVSLLSLLVALTLGQNRGFGDRYVWLLLVIFTAFLAVFIAIELRVPQPMIDLRLFQDRLFTISLVTGSLTFVAMAGTVLLMPFYLQDLLGYSPRQAGLLLSVVPAALGVLAPLSGSLSDRFGTRPITLAGLAILLVGFITVSTLDAETTSLGYILRFLPVGLGLGVFQSPNNSAIMGAAPRERLGIVSGMLAVNRTLGQTTGIAVLGALWASRVFAEVGETLPGGATTAPAAAQIAGLQQTVLVIVGLLAFALGLGIWGLVETRRKFTRTEKGLN
jgi:EmrB/QacA subfamily drug resistance transporter